MRYFKLPDLGEGLQEAEVVEWHVKAGDTVKTDQLLVSVETAKAIVEIPSPQDGKIINLFGKVGDIVHTGEPLLEFDSEETEDAGAVVGKVERSEDVVEDHFIIGSATPASAPTRARDDFRGDVRSGVHHNIKATPAIRALAKRLNVDLSHVQATGPNGLITSRDVEKSVKLEKDLGTPETLKGVRRSMAINMARAHSEVAQVTIHDDADIHHWPQGTDTTIRLVMALAKAATQEPALNAWYDGQAMTRRLIQHIDLGIAVDTPDGLFVPVLRNISERGEADLRESLDRLRADVKARTIPPKELQGATIMLSNFGTIAGKYANPIVAPPVVAIIGAGVIRQTPVVFEQQVVAHRILPLSLSFDHRCITGGEAGRFLAHFIAALQNA